MTYKISNVARKRKITLKEAKEQRSNLCKESLELKWNNESEENLNDKCPFCRDSNIENTDDYRDKWGWELNCKNCLCPTEICNNSGFNGYVKKLMDEYDNDFKIKELEPADLLKMQNLFKKYIIN